MKKTPFNISTLALATFLGVVALGVGAFASYLEPTLPFPKNSQEPIDIGSDAQGKIGGLSVYAFTSRGTAELKQDVQIKGTVLAVPVGQPVTTPSVVTVGSDTLVTGDVHAALYLNSATLKHNEAQPKPVCGDGNGNVVFC